MKEEKKKSSKLIGAVTRKNIQLPSPHQISVHSDFCKQNTNADVQKQIILNKHMRRIGCKSILRAYRTTIDESVLKSLDYSNQTEIGEARTKENRKQKQQKNKRKLKRIGHKKIINAYKEIISEMEKDQSRKRMEEQIQNRIRLCEKIKIDQSQKEQQRHSLLGDVILEQFQNKSEKNSLIRQSQIENQAPLVDSIIIRKIISEDDANINGDSFSININMVSNGTDQASKDMKMDNASIYEKSDGCLESLKTQSEQIVSQSVIIHGSFQRLIDQSEINSNAQIDQDQGQMKLLVQQINKNIQLSGNRQLQSEKQLQKLQPTHLVVPINKKLDVRTSINKKIQLKSQEEQFQVKNKQKIKSVHQPRKSQKNEVFEKTQQQKLLQMIEQKYNKNKKGNVKKNSKKNTLIRRNSHQKRSSQYNPKQIVADKKSPRMRKSKQMNDKLINKDTIVEQKENKENNNFLNQNKLKKPLPEPYPERENLQKSFNAQKDDLLMKSNVSLLQAPLQLSMGDKAEKKIIHTKESKASSNHIFASMHERAEKDWVNQKSNKKIYKKDYESSPSNSQNKRNNHKFQLNKCVNEARKLLTSSVHI